jgi:hypothetical protein
LTKARFVDGVPLGDRFVLAAFCDSGTTARAGDSNFSFRLYERTNSSLELKSEVTKSIYSYLLISDFNAFHGVIPFGDTHAAILVRTGYTDLRAILVKRTDTALSIVGETTVAGTEFQTSGHPIDMSRALLATRDYRNPGRIGLRVIKLENDSLSVGPTVWHTTPHTSGSAVAVMPVPGSSLFRVFDSQTNTTPEAIAEGRTNLMAFTVAVSGTNIVSGNDLAPAGNTDPLYHGLEMVGDALNNLFVFNTYPSGLRWSRFADGIYSSGGAFGSGDFRMWTGGNFAGSKNLMVSGRPFLRTASDDGTRIYYFDQPTTAPKTYNTTYSYSSVSQNTRMFRSGEKLIMIEVGHWRPLESEIGNGRIRMLSVPE